MRNFTNFVLLLGGLLSGCRENETISPAKPAPVVPVRAAIATFQSGAGQLKENDADQKEIVISLSKPAPADGLLVIKLTTSNSASGVDFTTSPASANGEIALPVAVNATSISFSIKPIQNTTVNNERLVQFVLNSGTGGVEAMANATFVLEIQDDELAGRLRKYESVAGSWRSSREYSYGGQGEVTGINWSTFTPFELKGSYGYQYENGKVVRMTEPNGVVTHYLWQNGRVVKSEKLEAEKLKQRIEFGYDDAGNVGEMVYYDRQPDGTLQRSMVIVFLYYLDGNIYKKLTYYVQDGQEPELSSTQTFENYLTKSNPLPMVETLPHLNPQPHLPRSYQLEMGGTVLEYQIEYKFRPDGLPSERLITGGSLSEKTYYTYH